MAQTYSFSVDTADLGKTAQHIKDKTEQYNKDITRLYSELEAMTTTQWKGVASETYRERLNGYKEEFTKLHSLLTTFAESLLTKKANYESTETSIKDAASSLPR